MNEIIDDYCLYEIFMDKCINIKDLAEIASTCPDFLRVAQRVYKSKFKKVEHYEEMENWTLSEMETYLQCFGEFIEEFDTNSFKDPIDVLYLLAKHCQYLVKLRCVGSLDIDFRKLKMLCSKLEEFEYCNGTFEGRHVFGNKSPLKKLTLYNCDAVLPKWQLPNLKDVKLQLVYQVGISKFFKRNPQISHLVLCCMNYNFNAIKYLANLEDFSFRAGFDEIMTFKGFEHLKTLKRLSLNGASTECIYEVLDGLQKAKAPLDSLTMHHYDINSEIITKICEFKTISVLTFKCELASRDLDSNFLIRIINNLPQLKEIICDSVLFEVSVAHKLLINFSHKLQSAFVKVDLFNYERDFLDMNAISTISRETKIRVELHTLLGVVSYFRKRIC